MFGLHNLFADGLVGLALFAVLVLFIGSVGLAIYSSITSAQDSSKNFTYVATVIAGLVLSVASGVIGKPANVQDAVRNSASSSSNSGQNISTPAPGELQARIVTGQASDFRTLYAWVYVITGLVCLVVFVCPTPSTHELVKGVGLTMLGFLITIVGGITSPTVAQKAEILLR